jgi:hypothetical protein
VNLARLSTSFSSGGIRSTWWNWKPARFRNGQVSTSFSPVPVAYPELLELQVEIGVSDMISRTFAPSDGPAVIKAASSRKYPA